MKKLVFFFGIELGRKGLSMADSSSRSLRTAPVTACGGQHIVKATLATYQCMQRDECFGPFWLHLESRRSSVHVSSHTSTTYMKGSQRLAGGQCFAENFDAVKDHYWKERGIQMLAKLKKTPTTVEPAQADIQEIISFYTTEFSSADCLPV